MQHALACTSLELLIVLVGYEREHMNTSRMCKQEPPKTTSEIIFSKEGVV